MDNLELNKDLGTNAYSYKIIYVSNKNHYIKCCRYYNTKIQQKSQKYMTQTGGGVGCGTGITPSPDDTQGTCGGKSYE